MIKILVPILFSFLMPFIVYFLWGLLMGQVKRKRDAEEVRAGWAHWPWARLSLIGGILAIGVMMYLVSSGEKSDGGVWVPAQVIDGEVVPGYFAPLPESVDPDDQ